MSKNELRIFNYGNQNVRTTIKNGEIWWVLKDVCEILGLSETHRVASRLEKDERTQMTVIDSLGRRQNTTIISEPGLYKVILRSDKPEAKKFTHWVTHEVLPSIRKHGAYITSDKMEELMSDPDTWVKLIRTLQQERQEKELLQNQIERDKPKVIFADAVAASESDVLIGELAKILKGNGIEVGQNRLFERLRRDGFLIKRRGLEYTYTGFPFEREQKKESTKCFSKGIVYMPTQRAMDLGLFKIKETSITHSDGHISISKTTKVMAILISEKRRAIEP